MVEINKIIDNNNVLLQGIAIAVRDYPDEGGASTFVHWFEMFYSVGAAKIATALYRLEQDNHSRAEGTGSGVYECRISRPAARQKIDQKLTIRHTYR
jgi:hypothetical protein